jgi:hypothetical protein
MLMHKSIWKASLLRVVQILSQIYIIVLVYQHKTLLEAELKENRL